MPFVTETVNGGYHTSDISSRLLKERIICLNGEVEEVLSASIVAQLLFLEADNPSKPISLYINSPGGSVTAGLAIYDTMQYIRSPVTTICLGQAASAASRETACVSAPADSRAAVASAISRPVMPLPRRTEIEAWTSEPPVVADRS